MEYDQLFKDFLRTFFKNFIALFFPEVHERLNWLEIEFLEKEEFTDIPKGKQRTTDLVVKVATKDGEPEIILVHVEVEGTWRSTFPYRMYEYYALLRLRLRLPVFPIAILPERKVKGFEPETYREELFGHEFLRFSYFHLGLPGMSVDDYWDDDNPVSWGLSALMDKGERNRILFLAECYRRTRDSNLNEAEKALLINFIETCYQLTLEEETQFQSLLNQIEYQEVREVRETFFDKLERRGREQGRIQGKQEALSQLMQVRFGELPQKVVDKVRKIGSEEELTILLDKVVTVSSLAELGLET